MNDNLKGNVYELFRQRSGKGGCFIRLPDGTDAYSYEDLDRRSGQYAAKLASMGLTPGERVIVQVEKSAECLFIYFGCLRAGLVYLPLNTAYQPAELEYFVGDAEPALIICDPSSRELFEGLTKRPVLTLDANGVGTVNHAPDETELPVIARNSDDTAVILYTSGTTGQPKGAMITHGNLATNGLALIDAWQWQDGDVMLHALPIFHIHGLFVATNVAVLNASPIILLPRFDPAEIIRLLPDATVYMGVPTNYTRLLAQQEFGQACCRNMRLFTSGSAPLLTQTFHEFQNRTGHTIVERYGMTETGMNTSNPLDGERKPGTVGPALPGVQLRIVDDEDEPAKTGVPGNLLIKGPNVFKGYWRKPEKTAEEFDAAGYFKTGDVASIDEDGYVSIVGRNKDLIITGGLNVYPKEIETIIDELPGVLESAVIGVPHDDFGEAVTAVIVPEADATITGEEIIAHLKSRVANFKVAKSVHFVSELPRNTMGKVQKNVLRDEFKGR